MIYRLNSFKNEHSILKSLNWKNKIMHRHVSSSVFFNRIEAKNIHTDLNLPINESIASIEI